MAKQQTTSKTNKPLQIALLIVLIAALVIGGYFLADALGADVLFSQGMPSPSLSSSASIIPATIRVKVLGAVNSPGEYVLPYGSIYQKAIDKAGGFTEKADVDPTIIGTELKDRAIIMVPEKTK